MNARLRLAMAVLARPWLWRSAFNFVPGGWWTRPPYLPIPPKEYVQFRMDTAYGDPERVPPPSDLVTFLGWVRKAPRVR